MGFLSQTQSYLSATSSELEVRNLTLHFINHTLRCWSTTFTKNARKSCTTTFFIAQKSDMGRDSVVGTVTRYGLDGPGSNPGEDDIFRTRPDWPWGPPASYRVSTVSYPKVKQPRRGVNHPSPLAPMLKNVVPACQIIV
jgi:hypothetical protein